MVSLETIRPPSQEERYQAALAEFERRREEILTAPPTPPSPVNFWERLLWERLHQRTQTTQPLKLSTEERLAALEREFYSWLFSDRKMVVCYLNANPEKQEEIINLYLQSPELTKDVNSLGEFLTFNLLEFFQQLDTGPAENLYHFIKDSPPQSLPSSLRQTKKQIFEPLFNLLGKQANEIFKNVREIGFFGVGQNLANALIESDKPLPDSFKKAYQEFVAELVKIEARITPIKPAEPEIKKPKKAPPTKITFKPKSPSVKQEPKPSPPSKETPPFSFWLILGIKTNPVEIPDEPTLEEKMKKIKATGPITPEDVWDRLLRIRDFAQQDPNLLRGEKVAGGPFEGWNKVKVGKQWVIIFKVENNRILFRFGSHEDVYGTRRRKPPDRARSL